MSESVEAYDFVEQLELAGKEGRRWMERTSLVVIGGIQISFLSELNNKLRYKYPRLRPILLHGTR